MSSRGGGSAPSHTTYSTPSTGPVASASAANGTLAITRPPVRGRYGVRSARSPLARSFPARSASANVSAPTARASHVSASVSTTAGGVPRVCRTPSTAWTAAYGGTRTSTDFPGARAPRTAMKCLTSSRVCSSVRGEAASAAVTSAGEARRRRAGTSSA